MPSATVPESIVVFPVKPLLSPVSDSVPAPCQVSPPDPVNDPPNVVELAVPKVSVWLPTATVLPPTPDRFWITGLIGAESIECRAGGRQIDACR